MRVSGRGVQDAKKIKQKAPDLHEKVKNGAMTHAQAKRAVERKEKLKALEETDLLGIGDLLGIDRKTPGLLLAQCTSLAHGTKKRRPEPSVHPPHGKERGNIRQIHKRRRFSEGRVGLAEAAL
jgi:hypothetical protein